MKTILCSLAINDDYIEKSFNLIESNLKYTDFDILIVTNKKEKFKNFNSRVKIIEYLGKTNSGNKFNMHLKRIPIKESLKMGYDYIIYSDCDTYIINWDNNSYNEFMSNDFDIGTVSNTKPQLKHLYDEYEHFRHKVDIELKGLFENYMFNAPNPNETRLFFKNNYKLKKFIEFWDIIENNNKDYFTYYNSVYVGVCIMYSNMKMMELTDEYKFSEYCKIEHNNKILNYKAMYE